MVMSGSLSRPRGESACAQKQTAPFEADCTVFAYLPSTPVRRWLSGIVQVLRRSARTSSETWSSIDLAAMSTVIASPSSTSAIGPPSTASGAIWPMHRPVDPALELCALCHQVGARVAILLLYSLVDVRQWRRALCRTSSLPLLPFLLPPLSERI